jgi:hypothetical protein
LQETDDVLDMNVEADVGTSEMRTLAGPVRVGV